MAEIEYPGVVQLIERVVWDHEAESLSLSTRTKIPLKSLISEGLSYSLSIAAQILHYFIVKQFIPYPWARPCVVSNPFC